MSEGEQVPEPMSATVVDGPALLSAAQREIERLRTALVDLGRLVMAADPDEEHWRVPIAQFVTDNLLPREPA